MAGQNEQRLRQRGDMFQQTKGATLWLLSEPEVLPNRKLHDENCEFSIPSSGFIIRQIYFPDKYILLFRIHVKYTVKRSAINQLKQFRSHHHSSEFASEGL